MKKQVTNDYTDSFGNSYPRTTNVDRYETLLRSDPPPPLVNLSTVNASQRGMLDKLLDVAERMGVPRAQAVKLVQKHQR